MGSALVTPTAPALDAETFRAALGRFATGVAFVAAAPGGEPTGLVVNSLASVSLDPPLVSFCPSRSSLTWSRMRRARHVGVSVLAPSHEAFARRATPPGADRFAGVAWTPGRNGAPILDGALAVLECDVVAEHPAGDHWIVVCRVDEARFAPIDEPLVFFAGAFGTVTRVRDRPGTSSASAGPTAGSIRPGPPRP